MCTRRLISWTYPKSQHHQMHNKKLAEFTDCFSLQNHCDKWHFIELFNSRIIIIIIIRLCAQDFKRCLRKHLVPKFLESWTHWCISSRNLFYILLFIWYIAPLFLKAQMNKLTMANIYCIAMLLVVFKDKFHTSLREPSLFQSYIIWLHFLPPVSVYGVIAFIFSWFS